MQAAHAELPFELQALLHLTADDVPDVVETFTRSRPTTVEKDEDEDEDEDGDDAALGACGKAAAALLFFSELPPSSSSTRRPQRVTLQSRKQRSLSPCAMRAERSRHDAPRRAAEAGPAARTTSANTLSARRERREDVVGSSTSGF